MRANSQRLDRKYKKLITPEGATQLETVYSRVSRCGMPAWVVTPNNEVLQFCVDHDIPASDAGPDDRDVLRQLIHAADTLLADRVFLVTGDCSFIDGDMLNEATDAFENYPGCILEYGPPVRGLPVRVIARETLHKIDEALLYHRKHGLTYGLSDGIRHESVRCGDLSAEVLSAGINMSLDTPADLDFVREIYKRVTPDASWEEALRCAYAISTLPSIRPIS